MRTIMMDVDGVLVCGRPQDGAHLFTDLERDLGIRLETLQQRFFAPHWPDIVTGRKPLQPHLATVLAEIAPDVPAETLIEYWFRNDSRIDNAVLDAMATLRAAGNGVFLATNQEHERAHYLMEDMGLSGHVDGIIYSAAIGHRKPGEAFYEAATRRAGVAAADIVLIDDTEENVLAARAFGWQAVHWRPGMVVTEVLEGLG